ncbi:hypothetical protein [Billgrantia saliphila]|uniref:hypothetical protein n=1 Tax=Billgrantia saliphila TaxID=1848458 RepID=UPI0012DC65AB|nr:hypothetical protein [Halomonas saliphila]
MHAEASYLRLDSEAISQTRKSLYKLPYRHVFEATTQDGGTVDEGSPPYAELAWGKVN